MTLEDGFVRPHEAPLAALLREAPNWTEAEDYGFLTQIISGFLQTAGCEQVELTDDEWSDFKRECAETRADIRIHQLKDEP